MKSSLAFVPESTASLTAMSDCVRLLPSEQRHIIPDQKSPNKLPWIRNGCSSEIEAQAEITLAYRHPQGPCSPYTAGSGVYSAMTKPLAARWTGGSPAVSSVALNMESLWESAEPPRGPQVVGVVGWNCLGRWVCGWGSKQPYAPSTSSSVLPTPALMMGWLS